LSDEFYDRFSNYGHVLLYQLDAFVFSDKLLDWCSANYDYIGAPWIDNSSIALLAPPPSLLRRLLLKNKTDFTRVVGNGGFSLRKVDTFRKSLRVWGHQARSWAHNEDVFWSLCIPNYYPLFRIPCFETALNFSFEVMPAMCYSLNRN